MSCQWRDRFSAMLVRMFWWSEKSTFPLTFLLSSLVLLPAYVNPDRAEDVDVVIRRCCYSGSEAGLAANPSQLTDAGSVCAESTINSLLSKNPASRGLQSSCLGAAQLCCLRELRIQQCSLGIQAAQNDSQCEAPSFGQTQKDCCVACKLGVAAALSGSSCLSDALFPALSSLWDTAFTRCCNSVVVDYFPPDVNPNLCETQGSNLCAHRCIPTVGSFRCECEPGYRLMQDERTCEFTSQSDRCSSKDNPCDHYCTDTGLAVECSCKKGFKLAPDRTSCLDVDECETSSHLCDNAVYNCKNRRGGYSCIHKTSGAELRMGPDAGDQIGVSTSNPEISTNTTRCPLGFSFNSESLTCDDIDECLLGRYVCEDNLNCKNTIGSFLCVNETVESCPPGFERTAGSTICSDIDECVRGSDACDRSVHFCLNTKGGFECVPRGASTGAAGRETSGVGARRGGCPAGFKADPVQRGNCIDVDECSENTHGCSPHERCRNVEGAYDCEPRCSVGYFLDPVLAVCRDFDECSSTSNNSCKFNEKCVNTPGSYKCVPRSPGTCPKGYRRAAVPGLCNDIDECVENPSICPFGTMCVNELGSHRCQRITEPVHRDSDPFSNTGTILTGRGTGPICSPGFEYDPSRVDCVDADECLSGEHTCSPSERCVNTQGSFSCSPTCGPGYKAVDDSGKCQDIDECVEGTHTCHLSTHVCRNSNGSYTCERLTECRKGYRRSQSGNCEDVNECETSLSPPCPSKHNCINTLGSFRCLPVVSTPTPTTPPLVRLTPVTPDPFDLWCPAGYRRNTFENKCIDVDECFENSNLCNTRTEVCVNVVGAYKCSPKASSQISTERSTSSTVSPSSSTLTPENPQSPTSRSGTGTSSSGDPQKCPRGFQYSPSARRCVDIDECSTSNPCSSMQSCRNTLGSYVCDCKEGFKKDPITHACIDINECQIGSAKCLDYQRCDNTIGSYTCVRLSSCGTGYTLNAETEKCEDDDECELGTHFCGTDRVCRNTLGSFRCEAPPLPDCEPGFVANETARRCVDVDECENSPCRPGYNCVNTVGSFECELALVCGTGYQQNESGNQCVDIDECSMGTHKCLSGQRCINRPGGYQCLCPKGHKMTDGVCKDVDECETFKGQVCPPMATCQNVVGSYHCICHEGYKSLDFENGHGCTDIDECSETPGICHHRCSNTPGSYRCGCDSGYVLAVDNRTCEDVNECEMFKDNRRVCVGHCVNQPGSFSCRCPHGYKLASDGRTCQDINECGPTEINPCNGVDEDCFNIRGSFRCNSLRCPPGYKRDESQKNRCNLQPCREYDTTCKTLPWSITSVFVSFTSNYPVPPSGRIDFFTLRMPNYASTRPRFSLKLGSVQAGDEVLKAIQKDFALRQESPTRKVISLITPLKGPQDIELHLSVEYYSDRNLFISTALHKIVVFVSANEF